MTTNPPPTRKGNPHTALDMFAPYPRTHHRRPSSQSRSMPNSSDKNPPPPVKILNSLLPVYDLGSATTNPPPLKARRSESSVASYQYSKASTPHESRTTLNEPPSHPRIPSNSTFSRVKKAASQLLRSRRVEPSDHPPITSPLPHGSSRSPTIDIDKPTTPRNRSSTISPTSSSNADSNGSRSSLLPLLSTDGKDVVYDRGSAHPPSLSTRPINGENISGENTASHDSATSLEATDTLNSNEMTITPHRHSEHAPTKHLRALDSVLRPIVSDISFSRKTGKQKGYVNYPTDKPKFNSSTHTNALSLTVPPMSHSSPSSPMSTDGSKDGSSNKNHVSGSLKKHRVTLNNFSKFESHIESYKSSELEHGINDQPASYTPEVKRASHTNVLNGEWNQPDMQLVIDKLRTLR